jgi:hypothetical protein
MERDTSWDNPQLSDGDNPSIKKQGEDLVKKWERGGLLDSLNQPNKINMASLLDGAQSCMLNEADLVEVVKKENENLDEKPTTTKSMAELMESEASVLLKKEIANLDDLNDYLRILADMDKIGIRRKIVLLEGFINKIKGRN